MFPTLNFPTVLFFFHQASNKQQINSRSKNAIRKRKNQLIQPVWKLPTSLIQHFQTTSKSAKVRKLSLNQLPEDENSIKSSLRWNQKPLKKNSCVAVPAVNRDWTIRRKIPTKNFKQRPKKSVFFKKKPTRHSNKFRRLTILNIIQEIALAVEKM